MTKLGSKRSAETVGDDSQSIKSTAAPIQVTTGTSRGSSSSSKNGVDLSAMQETMKPVSSNSVPIQRETFKNGNEVDAYDPSDLASSKKKQQLEGYGANRKTSR